MAGVHPNICEIPGCHLAGKVVATLGNRCLCPNHATEAIISWMHYGGGSHHAPPPYHGGGYSGGGYGGGYGGGGGGGGGYGATYPPPQGLGMYPYNHPPVCGVLEPPCCYHEWDSPVPNLFPFSQTTNSLLWKSI